MGIGLKLLQVLMSLTPLPKVPVLVLTYKNHALDEFLLDSLKFLNEGDIARIGGRSKEPTLSMCNLSELKRSSKFFDEKLEEIRIEREQLESELKEGMQNLQDAGMLRIEDLQESLDDEQLKTLYFEA